MPIDKATDAPATEPLTVFVEELYPGLVVTYEDRPQQVRGVGLHGSRSLGADNRTLTQHNATFTVVFCDEEGRVSTVDLPISMRLRLVFFEVFEPGIPAGYVSRKNFKKCYEDSLASVDGVNASITEDHVVKLTYSKPSGKYYSEGQYATKETSFWSIVHEVYTKLLKGDNPGLLPLAVLRNDFTTSISIQREELSVPHVITVHALCAEMARRSQNDASGYAKSVPKEALDMYERHRRDLSYIIPDHLQNPAELIDEVGS